MPETSAQKIGSKTVGVYGVNRLTLHHRWESVHLIWLIHENRQHQTRTMRISTRLSPLLTASQCPPTDTEGVPLGTSYVSGLVCIYPGADCPYFASDGALSLDASAQCPNSLLSVAQSSSSLATESQCPPTDNNNGTLAAGVEWFFGPWIDDPVSVSAPECTSKLEFPNPHRVPKFQFNNHYPKFSTHQVTGDVSGSTTVRNRIPVRVITGISVTLAVVALCFVVFLFLQVRSRRRAARIGTIEIDQQARAISPFTLITEIGAVNNDSPSDTRRTGALQEKMLDLEAIERPSNRGSPEVHAELQAAKAQINVVVERMNAL
ncbi:hypothetical protein B0H13DRAFT_1883440 [Mycena leptocephala]|nr:hypothetical protein B0H13DRAFT_1883440 [Mycena leptocephala]